VSDPFGGFDSAAIAAADYSRAWEAPSLNWLQPVGERLLDAAVKRIGAPRSSSPAAPSVPSPQSQAPTLMSGGIPALAGGVASGLGISPASLVTLALIGVGGVVAFKALKK
jgi:hypothetical protein